MQLRKIGYKLMDRVMLFFHFSWAFFISKGFSFLSHIFNQSSSKERKAAQSLILRLFIIATVQNDQQQANHSDTDKKVIITQVHSSMSQLCNLYERKKIEQEILLTQTLIVFYVVLLLKDFLPFCHACLCNTNNLVCFLTFSILQLPKF